MNPARSLATFAVMAALGAMPLSARAQDVHKCVDNGHVTYQSGPCAHGDTVLHVRPTAPTASDAEAAASRAQAQKDAIFGKPPTDAGTTTDSGPATSSVAAPADGTCKSLSQQYGAALANQDAINHQTTKVSPGGKSMASVDDARDQARKQVQAVEAQLRAAGCKVARP